MQSIKFKQASKSKGLRAVRVCWIIEATRLFLLCLVTGDRRHLRAGIVHLAAVYQRIITLLP